MACGRTGALREKSPRPMAGSERLKKMEGAVEGLKEPKRNPLGFRWVRFQKPRQKLSIHQTPYKSFRLRRAVSRRTPFSESVWISSDAKRCPSGRRGRSLACCARKYTTT